MHTRRIALLGAPGSGKTWLARQLAQAFSGAGQDVQVDEVATLEALLPLPPAGLLLLGLDLKPPTQAQLQADRVLRQALAAAAEPFQVIYGQGQQRLLNALQALGMAGADAKPKGADAQSMMQPEQPASAAKRKPWVWACEKCSDPVCEHRLLSDLLAKR